jgi:hypothetical protein
MGFLAAMVALFINLLICFLDNVVRKSWVLAHQGRVLIRDQ